MTSFGRPLCAFIVAALVAGLVACGGDDSGAIPGDVATPLAERADQIAAAAEDGDDCTAAQLADELQGDLGESGDEIPPEVRAELERTVQRLVDELNCEPPPPAETITVPVETQPEEKCPKELKDAIKDDELRGEDFEELPSDCLKHLEQGGDEDEADEGGGGPGNGRGNGGGEGGD